LPAQPPQPAPHLTGTLRVGLWTLWHDREITVSPTPSASIRLCESCKPLPLAAPQKIRAAGSNLQLPGNNQAQVVSLSGIVTLAAHGETLQLQNPLRISAHSGELTLSVTLPVESYVERVVASESGATDSPESLQALAIVVRSFALHQSHGHADYDLCDSTHCQLLHWAGNPERRAAAHAATLATSGETLWFHGHRAEAWFHQNCGGQTATPAELWPSASRHPMPWLASRPDTYCTAHGAREWSANISLADLTAVLATSGLARPGWKTLVVARRGDSGRAETLMADRSPIPAEEFRLAVGRALGWNKILSTWFEIAPQGDAFAFHGRGSGHGVGLCQAGSAAMAAAGRDSTQILAQYFPGAVALDEATGLPWQSFPGQVFQLQTLRPSDAAYLPQLSQALQEAESRSGLRPEAEITLRTFPSTQTFRQSTLAPGWVAAFTEGNWIGTQPLATLAARKLLDKILRHEFLHALVESRAAPGSPLWLREGLVELWSGEPSSATAMKLEQVDAALAHARTVAESEAAHHAAAFYAARALDRYGKATVLAWLRTGVPTEAMR
jgi:stage II sporulation protein D